MDRQRSRLDRRPHERFRHSHLPDGGLNSITEDPKYPNFPYDTWSEKDSVGRGSLVQTVSSLGGGKWVNPVFSRMNICQIIQREFEAPAELTRVGLFEVSSLEYKKKEERSCASKIDFKCPQA